MNRPEHVVEIKLTEALKAAGDLGNEVNRLRKAIREIAFEVSTVGCEGADDAICIETTRAKEDWCPYCRIGTIVRDAQLPDSTVTHTGACEWSALRNGRHECLNGCGATYRTQAEFDALTSSAGGQA